MLWINLICGVLFGLATGWFAGRWWEVRMQARSAVDRAMDILRHCPVEDQVDPKKKAMEDCYRDRLWAVLRDMRPELMRIAEANCEGDNWREVTTWSAVMGVILECRRRESAYAIEDDL